MSVEIIIVLVVIVLGFSVLFWILSKRGKPGFMENQNIL